MLKVYTTNDCVYCHALMNWLDEEGISYAEIDAEGDSSITSVPVTVVEDTKGNETARIIGFDRPAIKKALKELKSA